MRFLLLACGSDKANDTAPNSMATLPDEATELLQGPIVTCADPSALSNSYHSKKMMYIHASHAILRLDSHCSKNELLHRNQHAHVSSKPSYQYQQHRTQDFFSFPAWIAAQTKAQRAWRDTKRIGDALQSISQWDFQN